ncbi:polyprenyl synthetase family protein [Metabacillus arenae]|uniref:Polyprenyl synthetase family protein n=1 Tax=Metabacillus arenae TaxID=2771434 RepID=A0A926NIZ5_9BACI|nr:polyprenyl synthetase family protein [Metabacillus arenae]MBD1380873.1 polyprenyl synthetase family protein [Metabacillus arenae]
MDGLILDETKLKNTVYHIITSEVKNTHLSELILSFFNSRKRFLFGQLTFMHYHIFGGKREDVYHLVSAIELVTLAIDIFDDLEDLDNYEEPWMQVKHSISLNAASLLLTISQKIVYRLSNEWNTQLLNIYQDYLIEAAEGQHEDLLDWQAFEETCLLTIKMKSGALTALASACGSMLASKRVDLQVEKYAYQIGIAAQLDNDLNDLFSSQKTDSKIIDKNTLASIFLRTSTNPFAKKLLANIKKGNFTYTEEYKQLLLKSGVVAYLSILKQTAIQMAITHMDELDLPRDHIEILKDHLIYFK